MNISRRLARRPLSGHRRAAAIATPSHAVHSASTRRRYFTAVPEGHSRAAPVQAPPGPSLTRRCWMYLGNGLQAQISVPSHAVAHPPLESSATTASSPVPAAIVPTGPTLVDAVIATAVSEVTQLLSPALPLVSGDVDTLLADLRRSPGAEKNSRDEADRVVVDLRCLHAEIIPALREALLHGSALSCWPEVVRVTASAMTALEAARRATGRLYTALFPSALVVALCVAVLPLHDRANAAHRAWATALAGRLVQLHHQLPPTALAVALHSLQRANALSDNALSPTAKSLLDCAYLQRHTAAGGWPAMHRGALTMVTPGAAHLLTGEAAALWGGVLGHQAAPGHLHLHRVFHAVVLPPLGPLLKAQAQIVSDAAADGAHTQAPELLPYDVLRDLLRGFVRYAVAGEELVGSLLTLCMAQLPTLDLDGLLDLLRTLTPPAKAAVVPEKRQRRNAADSVETNLHPRRLRHPKDEAAAEYYQPLIGAACRAVAQLLALHVGLHSDGGAQTNQLAVVQPAAAAASPPTWERLVDTITTLVRVCRSVAACDTTAWETAYAIACTHLLQLLTAPAAPQHISPRDAARLLGALLRGAPPEGNLAAPPSHPLYPLLLHKILQPVLCDPTCELLQDAAAASTVLAAAMRLESWSRAAAAAGQERLSEAAVEDRRALLRLFRHHGSQLRPGAFVAAVELLSLPVLPAAAQQQQQQSPRPLLWELPLASQSKVVAHVGLIAASIPPQALARVIVALLGPYVAAMDDLQRHGHDARRETELRRGVAVVANPITLRRWLTRFTAEEVVRGLRLRHCADLLYVLGRLSSWTPAEAEAAGREPPLAAVRRDNAVAIQMLVDRVGRALKRLIQDDREADADEEDGVGRRRRRLTAALATVPRLAEGLRAADLYYPHLLSRLCRLVYAGCVATDAGAAPPPKGSSDGGVLLATPLLPLSVLLPSFRAVAAEWTLRRRGTSSGAVGADGTVFRDAWEVLRGRLLAMQWDEGSGAGGADPVPAVLGGAVCAMSLDTYTGLVTALQAWNAFALLDPTDTPLFLVLLQRLWEMAGPLVSPPPPSSIGTTEAALALDTAVAPPAPLPLGALLGALDAGAVAALVVTLLLRNQYDTETSPVVDALLGPALLVLGQNAALQAQLHPFELVLLLESLLGSFLRSQQLLEEEGVKDRQQPHWLKSSLNQQLLHQAYDACRTALLAACPPPASAPITDPSPPSGHKAGAEKEEDGVVLHEPQTLAAGVVPPLFFAHVLVALANVGMEDADLATACAAQLLRHRHTTAMLSMDDLVNAFLALCFHFPPGPAASPHRAVFLRPVLDALWRRTEEMTRPQLHAVRRCVSRGGGRPASAEGPAGDADFLERLASQEACLAQREAAAERATESEPTRSPPATAAPVPLQEPQIAATPHRTASSAGRSGPPPHPLREWRTAAATSVPLVKEAACFDLLGAAEGEELSPGLTDGSSRPVEETNETSSALFDVLADEPPL